MVVKKRFYRVWVVEPSYITGQLAMPYKIVCIDLQPVFLGVFNEFIGRFEIVLVPTGVYNFGFHDVFRGNRIELLRNEAGGSAAIFPDLHGAQRGANKEITFKRFFK